MTLAWSAGRPCNGNIYYSTAEHKGNIFTLSVTHHGEERKCYNLYLGKENLGYFWPEDGGRGAAIELANQVADNL